MSEQVPPVVLHRGNLVAGIPVSAQRHIDLLDERSRVGGPARCARKAVEDPRECLGVHQLGAPAAVPAVEQLAHLVLDRGRHLGDEPLAPAGRGSAREHEAIDVGGKDVGVPPDVDLGRGVSGICRKKQPEGAQKTRLRQGGRSDQAEQRLGSRPRPVAITSGAGTLPGSGVPGAGELAIPTADRAWNQRGDPHAIALEPARGAQPAVTVRVAAVEAEIAEHQDRDGGVHRLWSEQVAMRVRELLLLVGVEEPRRDRSGATDPDELSVDEILIVPEWSQPAAAIDPDGGRRGPGPALEARDAPETFATGPPAGQCGDVGIAARPRGVKRSVQPRPQGGPCGQRGRGWQRRAGLTS
ncbi:MAG: hypothetical protein E6J91_23520 [Deltaproteobacteria bacterium]|nr:MAG: hypothetical protein E6J91_23520 [Deltaproteobacteria bacterium]